MAGTTVPEPAPHRHLLSPCPLTSGQQKLNTVSQDSRNSTLSLQTAAWPMKQFFFFEIQQWKQFAELTPFIYCRESCKSCVVFPWLDALMKASAK